MDRTGSDDGRIILDMAFTDEQLQASPYAGLDWEGSWCSLTPRFPDDFLAELEV